ncbi:MAG: hypothetical protein M1353_06320 [Nitrospirae bacterium]|nr:hypothetical protein [Nitrospirota bacterium]
MGSQELIEQYKEAYKRANGNDCPYEITCSKGLFILENRETGFDYKCRKDEFIRITYSLHARTK